MTPENPLDSVNPGLDETLKFYNGEVVLHYNHDLHLYYASVVDGAGMSYNYAIANVTNITGMVDKSQPLMWWAANEAVYSMCRSVFGEGTPEFDLAMGLFLDMKEGKKPDKPEKCKYTCVNEYDFAAAMNAARKAHKEISKEAKDIGHQVHKWLEDLIKDAIQQDASITSDFVTEYIKNKVPMPGQKEAIKCCTSAVDWMVKHEFKPIWSERKIFSREYFYSGTLDWLALITLNGKRIKVLGDFKTSKSIHNEYKMQLAAYWKALTEEFPEHNDIEMLCILRLGKDDGSFDAMEIPREEFDVHFTGFEGAIATYNWMLQQQVDEKANAPARPKRRATPRKVKIPTKEYAPIPTE